MTDHEIPPIGDEIRKHLEDLERAANKQDDEEPAWSEEDKAKLEAEVASLEFVPDLVPGFPDKSITFEGQRVLVHETSNFSIALTVARKYKKAREAENPEEAIALLKASLDPFQIIKLESLMTDKDKTDTLFTKLAAGYPYLYRKMAELSVKADQKSEARKAQRSGIRAEVSAEDLFLSEEDKSAIDYYFSAGLDAVARILGEAGQLHEISGTITSLIS